MMKMVLPTVPALRHDILHAELGSAGQAADDGH